VKTGFWFFPLLPSQSLAQATSMGPNNAWLAKQHFNSNSAMTNRTTRVGHYRSAEQHIGFFSPLLPKWNTNFPIWSHWPWWTWAPHPATLVVSSAPPGLKFRQGRRIVCECAAIEVCRSPRGLWCVHPVWLPPLVHPKILLRSPWEAWFCDLAPTITTTPSFRSVLPVDSLAKGPS
jgi:hypothetical protein